jgi:hypothetical protein
MEGLAMSKTGILIRLVMPVLVASTFEGVVAGEPVGTPAPAKSIREWNPTPNAAPAAKPAATPEAHAAVEPVGPTIPAKSIRDWHPTTNAAPIASPCGPPAVIPVAKTAVRAVAPASAITISISSTLRQGSLVVMIDDVPIFNEKFQKPVLLFSQTTTWDPVQIPAGQHRLAAKVYGTKKTYLSALYDLTVSGAKGSSLRFVMKGDKLTVEVAS